MILKVIFTICCLYLTTINSDENVNATNIQEINPFYVSLYKALNRRGNFVFSPVSVETLLFLAYDGSDGTTRETIQRVVWPLPTETPSERFRNIVRTVRNTERAILLEPNKIFIAKGFKLNSSYTDTVKRKYLTDVQTVNFSDREKATAAINQWIESVTNHGVRKFIKQHDLDADCRLILSSCVNFIGNWSLKFKSEDTKRQTFYVHKNDMRQVEMMYMHNKTLNISEDTDLNAKILVMDFEDNNYVLTIFLPHLNGNIEDMKSKLLGLDKPFGLNKPISEYIRNTKRRLVNVALPKFSVESDINLKQPLINMGLAELFSSSANFSLMVENANKSNRLFINNIIQKAYIEIDEDGAGGIIATSSKYSLVRSHLSPDVSPVDFIVNRPFVFFISAGATQGSFIDIFSGQFYGV